MRSLLLPCLLVACAQPTPPPEASVPEPVNAPLVEPLVQQEVSAPPPLIDSAEAPPRRAPGRTPRPETDEGCVEHIDASPAGVRAVQYAAKDAMKAREAEIESTLASAWMMAEQGASVSIADDFERGIATEHTDMPDTLDVTIMYYARCSSRSPHTVQHFRVWRKMDGGLEWRLR
jgi:hypothetical protein